MTKYKIIPDGLKAFGVEVSSPNRFLSVRGFATELDAAAWIAEQQAGEAAVAAAEGALSEKTQGSSGQRSAQWCELSQPSRVPILR